MTESRARAVYDDVRRYLAHRPNIMVMPELLKQYCTALYNNRHGHDGELDAEILFDQWLKEDSALPWKKDK